MAYEGEAHAGLQSKKTLAKTKAHPDEHEREQFPRKSDPSQLVYTTQLLFIIVVFSSKITACLLIYRLTCHKAQRIATLAIVAASVICCFISLIVLSIGINGKRLWIHRQDAAETVVSLVRNTCFHVRLLTLPQTRRWIVYTSLTNLLDFSIVALAIALVYNLKMKPIRKTKIVAIFALRLG
jgi:hypothetical protein